MNWPMPTAHDFAIVLSEIAWCVFAFVHPEIMDHLDGSVFPVGATGIAGGLALAKGTQRAIQGGTTGTDIITPVAKPAEVVITPVPFVKPT